MLSILDLVIRKKIVDTEAALYYEQPLHSAGAKVTPLWLGKLLNSGCLRRLFAGCQLAQQARRAGASTKCKQCKIAAGEGDAQLLACCFCASNYHNTESCLGVAAMTGQC